MGSSIEDMVSGSMGYVTAEDKQRWQAAREQIAREKEENKKSVLRDVAGAFGTSMLELSEKNANARLQAATMAERTNAPRRKKITKTTYVDEQTVAEYDRNGNEIEF